jgi:Spy/CpxP family protein refolding chaperone
MFESNSRARSLKLGALVCVAVAVMSACAHTQQTPPSDSASPRSQGDWHRGGGDGSRMRHRGGPHGDPMLESLNLTTDQKSQVRLIRDKYRLKADSLRAGNAARDSTNRAQFRTVMTQEMGEIRALLTPDQQKQFDDKMAKMKERHEQHGDHGGPGGPGGHDGPPPPPPPAE